MMSLKNNLPQSWVLAIAFFMLIFPLVIVELPTLQYSKGVVVYPQDEAYVRMATAKSLAFNYNWGLSESEFNSASSSIIYPILLAFFYKLFGVQLAFPFLINLFTAMVFIVFVARWLEKQRLRSFSQASILAAIILLTPLPVLVAGGMEHMLQVLFSFLFLAEFSAWLIKRSEELIGYKNLSWKIYALAVLMTITRYEGLLLVLIACLILVFNRRYFLSIALGVLAVLPLILFGIYSLQKGAYFIPTSLMMKAIPLPLNGGVIQKYITNELFARLIFTYNTSGAIATTRLLIILPLVYWLFLSKIREQSMIRYMLLTCLSMIILHLMFSSVVLFFRYEAYLITCSAIVVGVLISQNWEIMWPKKGASNRWMALWTGTILLYPLFFRGWAAYKSTCIENLNTYEQSFQAAKFIQRYYNHSTIVTDYIGTTGFLSEGKKIDLNSGIGYTEIAKSRVDNFYRTEYVEYLLRIERPVIAVIPENRYNYAITAHWKKVADWYTNHASPYSGDHLSFYSLDSMGAPRLRNELKAFEPSLPPAVKVVYL